MLSVSGMGLGAGAPFTCNETICYGSDGGETHALFKESQYQMNRLAMGLIAKRKVEPSFRLLGVDGFIGKQTFEAARLLFPNVSTLKMYATAGNYRELAQMISVNRMTFPVLLQQAADLAAGYGEAPAEVKTRTEAYAKEGPPSAAAGGATNSGAGPSYEVPGTPSSPQAPPRRTSAAFVWIMGGLAVVGTVAAVKLATRGRHAHA